MCVVLRFSFGDSAAYVLAALHAGVVRRVNGRAKVNRVALERGWRASALRLLDVVKLSVEVR
jgi:hypothetical protein